MEQVGEGAVAFPQHPPRLGSLFYHHPQPAVQQFLFQQHPHADQRLACDPCLEQPQQVVKIQHQVVPPGVLHNLVKPLFPLPHV